MSQIKTVLPILLLAFWSVSCLSKYSKPGSGNGGLDDPSPTPTPVATPTPNPTPNPTPSPTPDNSLGTKGPLTKTSWRFIDKNGEQVYLVGAIICCEKAKDNGWPLIDKPTLNKLAAHKVNFTHIRLGPFVEASEGVEFIAYKRAGLKQDLNDWNPLFWQKVREIIAHAKSLGIYVEVDLIDGWVLENFEYSAWNPNNNINGVSQGCESTHQAPSALHDRWLQKVVDETGEFDNVIYQVSNESFDCGSSLTWEAGVAEIARARLAQKGFGARLIGANSHKAAVESDPRLDFTNYHSSEVRTAQNGKPLACNECIPNDQNQTAGNYDNALRQAFTQGSHYHLWRGDMSDSQWDQSLNMILQFQTERGL